MSFGGSGGGGGDKRGISEQQARISSLVQKARDDRRSARSLSQGPGPSARGRNGPGPSDRDVQRSNDIFRQTGSSLAAAGPLYGGGRSRSRRRTPPRLAPLDIPSPGAPPNTPVSSPGSSRASTPGSFDSDGPSPPPNIGRPSSAASTASTDSTDSGGSDFSFGLGALGPHDVPIDISYPSPPTAPRPPNGNGGRRDPFYLGGGRLPTPALSPMPPPPRAQTPESPGPIELAATDGGGDDFAQPAWPTYNATEEQAGKAIDYKDSCSLMRMIMRASPDTQARAAKLEAAEQSDRQLMGGMAAHDDKASTAETAATVGGAVGAVTTAVLAATPAAPAAPFVAGATVAFSIGAKSKAAYEHHQSANSIDRVKQYVDGDTSVFDARIDARTDKRNENIGGAVGSVVTTAADVFAPGAGSAIASAASTAANKVLSKRSANVQVAEAQAVLASPDYSRPPNPPPDGDFSNLFGGADPDKKKGENW